MLQRIAPVLILLMLIATSYLYCRFLRKRAHSVWRTLLILVPPALLLVALVLLICTESYSPTHLWLTGLYMTLYLLVIVPELLLTLFLGIGQLGRRFSRRWDQAWSGIGIIVSLLVFGIIFYASTYGWRKFQVKEVTYASADLPAAFDGYRMVQISDLHIGTIAPYKQVVQQMVDKINAQHANVILFTGDLVNHRAEELDGVQEILSELTAPDGVYSVMGNHDYSLYLHWPSEEAREENIRDLRQRQADMGWHQLVNDHVLLQRDSTAIVLAGVENDGVPPFPELGDLPRALQGTDGRFKVLLSHDPTHWRRKVLPTTDVQLTLSGHTHAMQFMLGDFTPSAWFYPENHGMYTEGDRALYVNIGVGQVMLPFRFGAWPEITVITLRKK